MLSSFPLLLALVVTPAQESDATAPAMNWHMHIANMSVPDPTRPNAVPNLGYTGLWRSIYGQRDEVELPDDGFAPGARFRIDPDGGDLTDLQRRQPRIRTARWVAIAQQFHDLPAFEVPRASLDESVAAFVWNHQLEQVNDIWSKQRYAMAPTSTPRDYVPNIVVEQDEQKFSDEAKKGNFLLTVAVAVIATILLVVIVFMPK